MRILVLSHMYPRPYDPTYGIFIHQQVRELVRKGCEVAVISPVQYAPFPLAHLSTKWKNYRQTPPHRIWDDIVTHYPRYLALPRDLLFQHSGRLMARGIAPLVRSLRANFKFDLIHAHVALPDGFAATLLKEEYPVPVIVSIHGADLQVTIHRSKKEREAVGRVFAKADQIVTVSNKLKRIAIDHFGHGPKITTIANGIFPTAPSAGPVGLPRQRRMVSVSNLKRSKGIDLNLRALAALGDKYPDLTYRIIGEGPDRARLQNLSKSLNLPPDRVEFTGRLANRRALEEMARSTLFSLPSWQEGFGVVYIEAMAQGKPVIACQGEGIEDVIEHGKNGLLVKPQDLESLIGALDLLLADPAGAAAIGAAAKKTVLEHYTWEKNVEKTLILYRKALGAQPASDRVGTGETG